MLCARAVSTSFFTLGTMATQRGRTPQLSFMRSSTSSAVVFASTVTGLSSGFGGSFTLSHSVVMSPAAAKRAAEKIAAAIRAMQNFDAVRSMANLLAPVCMTFAAASPRSSLPRLREVFRLRRQLALLGGHQIPVPAHQIIVRADGDIGGSFQTCQPAPV